jgi:transketolase
LNETIASYSSALQHDGPSVLALSRQKLKEFPSSVQDAMKGGYIVGRDGRGSIDAVIIATGSEVSLALEVKSNLQKLGYNVRVVSMPCVELFEKQSDKYKEDILPKSIKSIFAIEAGSTLMWHKYTGRYGKCFGVDDFGDSGTPQDMFNKFGLNAETITKEIVKGIKVNR